MDTVVQVVYNISHSMSGISDILVMFDTPLYIFLNIIFLRMRHVIHLIAIVGIPWVPERDVVNRRSRKLWCFLVLAPCRGTRSPPHHQGDAAHKENDGDDFPHRLRYDKILNLRHVVD